MKKKKQKRTFESNPKFGFRKAVGRGVVSAIIGLSTISAYSVGVAQADENDVNINYKYVSTDELTTDEMRLITSELPDKVKSDTDVFVVYRKNSTKNKELPKTGTHIFPSATLIGAGFLIVALSFGKQTNRKRLKIKSLILFSTVGGLTVSSVSAITSYKLSNYNHVEQLRVGDFFPTGRVDIEGYSFVGYISEEVLKENNLSLNNIKQEIEFEKPEDSQNVSKFNLNNNQKDPKLPSSSTESEGKTETNTRYEQRDFVAPKIIRRDDPNLYEGEEKILQEGKEGYTNYAITDTYLNNKLIDTKSVPIEVIKPEDKIILYGTKVKESKPINVQGVKEANIAVPSITEEVISEEEVGTVDANTSDNTNSKVVKDTEASSVQTDDNNLSAENSSKDSLDSSVNTVTNLPSVPQKSSTKNRTVIVKEELAYDVVVEEDSNLEQGKTIIENDGQFGLKEKRQEVTVVDGVEVSRTTVSENLVREPVNKVIRVGVGTQKESKEDITSSSTGEVNKEEQGKTNENLIKTEPVKETYSMEIKDSTSKKVVRDASEIEQISKDTESNFNISYLTPEKRVQLKTIEIYDNSILEGQRQLKEVQASYVTVLIKRKREQRGTKENIENVLVADIPLITRIELVGTKKSIPLTGYVYNSEKKILEETDVKIYNGDSVESTVKTDVEGYLFYHFEPNKQYKLIADGFESEIIVNKDSTYNIVNVKGEFSPGMGHKDEGVNYKLKPDVIHLAYTDLQVLSDDGKKVILSAPINVQVGDVIVIPPGAYTRTSAIKVNSIIQENGKSIIIYDKPSIYDVLDYYELDSKTVNLADAHFIPAKNVIEIDNSKIDTEESTVSERFSQNIGLVKGTHELSVGIRDNLEVGVKIGLDGSVEVGGRISTNKSDNSSFVIKPKFKVDLELYGQLTFAKWELKKKDNNNDSDDRKMLIKLGEIPLPIQEDLFLSLPIYAVLSGSGDLKVNLETGFSLSSKFEFENFKLKKDKSDDNSKIDKNFELSVELSGEAKLGADLKIIPQILETDLPIFIHTESGIKATSSVTSKEPNMTALPKFKIYVESGIKTDEKKLGIDAEEKFFEYEYEINSMKKSKDDKSKKSKNRLEKTPESLDKFVKLEMQDNQNNNYSETTGYGAKGNRFIFNEYTGDFTLIHYYNDGTDPDFSSTITQGKLNYSTKVDPKTRISTTHIDSLDINSVIYSINREPNIVSNDLIKLKYEIEGKTVIDKSFDGMSEWIEPINPISNKRQSKRFPINKIIKLKPGEKSDPFKILHFNDSWIGSSWGDIEVQFENTVGKAREKDVDSLFKKLNKPFIFSSGAGAWSNSLVFEASGRFKGTYSDTDMVTDRNLPYKAERYLSIYNGRFDEIKKVNDYEYSVILSELKYPEPNQERVSDNILIKTADPYGLGNSKSIGDEFIIYLAGRRTDDLPDSLKVDAREVIGKDKKLTHAVLFNKKYGYAFVEGKI